MSWLDWLTIEAKNGNAEALTALRARSKKDGTVFYRIGNTAVSDNGKLLFVSQNTFDDSLTDVLQVAINKYGNHLSVNGSDEFKSAVVQTTVQSRICVTFDDPELERHRNQLSRQVVFQKRSKTSMLSRSL